MTLCPCGSVITWRNRITSRQTYSLDSGPQANIDGEADFTAISKETKDGAKKRV